MSASGFKTYLFTLHKEDIYAGFFVVVVAIYSFIASISI